MLRLDGKVEPTATLRQSLCSSTVQPPDTPPWVCDLWKYGLLCSGRNIYPLHTSLFCLVATLTSHATFDNSHCALQIIIFVVHMHDNNLFVHGREKTINQIQIEIPTIDFADPKTTSVLPVHPKWSYHR